MSALWFTGFDQFKDGDSLPLLGKFALVQTNQGWQTIQATTGRDSGGCLRWGLGFAITGGITKQLDSDLNELWQAGAFYIHGNQLVPFTFLNGSSAELVTITRNNTSGLLEVRKGSGAGTIIATSVTSVPTGQWVWIGCRVKFHASTGTVSLQIGDVREDFTGLDTAGASGDCRYARAGSSTLGGLISLDDWCGGDVTGSYNNDVPTNRRIYYAQVGDDAGTNDFTLSAGSDHYAMVDDANLDDDTTYAESSTPGDQENFGALVGLPSDVSVLAVSVFDNSKGGGNRKQSLTGSAGTRVTGAAKATNASVYEYANTIWEEDPDTAAPFTTASLADADVAVGIEVTA